MFDDEALQLDGTKGAKPNQIKDSLLDLYYLARRGVSLGTFVHCCTFRQLPHLILHSRWTRSMFPSGRSRFERHIGSNSW